MKIKHLIIGLWIATLFASCGSEFKLAKSFNSQAQQTKVAVYFPEEAWVSLEPDADGAYSMVLDSVNQNLFLDLMYAAYADELKAYGLDVYVPDDAGNIEVDSLHWLVIVSKVELLGRYTTYVDHLYDFVDVYDYSFSLNTINVASWFDMNDGEWHPTQYDEYNLRDEFSSRVSRSRENGTQYHYNITPLKKDDVYDFAVFLGKREAAFTYDYMMNRYIESALRVKNRTPRFKLRWDPRGEEFYYQLDDEGFISLE